MGGAQAAHAPQREENEEKSNWLNEWSRKTICEWSDMNGMKRIDVMELLILRKQWNGIKRANGMNERNAAPSSSTARQANSAAKERSKPIASLLAG